MLSSVDAIAITKFAHLGHQTSVFSIPTKYTNGYMGATGTPSITRIPAGGRHIVTDLESCYEPSLQARLPYYSSIASNLWTFLPVWENELQVLRIEFGVVFADDFHDFVVHQLVPIMR